MIVTFAPSALEDRSRIWLEGCERFEVDVADHYIDRLDEVLKKTLGAFPNSGRARPEFGSDIRSFPMVPYVAFYRMRNRRVEVLRVLHGHRDLTGALLSLLVAV